MKPLGHMGYAELLKEAEKMKALVAEVNEAKVAMKNLRNSVKSTMKMMDRFDKKLETMKTKEDI